MSVSPSFRDFVLEQFRQVAPVTTRPMFGGLCIFHDGRAFALIDDDRLYIKTDASNRGDFEKAGCGPFLPFGDPAKPMAYHELPGEVLEDSDELSVWMRKAFLVAARAKTSARKRKP